jgi:hypothetical protein
MQHGNVNVKLISCDALNRVLQFATATSAVLLC